VSALRSLPVFQGVGDAGAQSDVQEGHQPLDGVNTATVRRVRIEGEIGGEETQSSPLSSRTTLAERVLSIGPLRVSIPPS